MAEIPKSVTIGPHKYTILRCPKVVDQGRDLNGECDPDELVIRLRKYMRRSMSREILLHEVMHALAANGGSPIPDKMEEKFVTVMAPALLQVLRDNPDLLKFLISQS